MVDSISDLLKKRGNDEPPEIQAIKQYVQTKFSSACTIILRDNQIIVSVASASLAGTLRMHQTELKQAAKTDKRLQIRIH